MGIGEKDEGAAGSLVQEGPPAARKAPYRTVLRPRSGTYAQGPTGEHQQLSDV